VTGLPLDEGLLRRLREAGTAIRWTPASGSKRARGTLRVARLREEEATVEVRDAPTGGTVEVAAGPVGAVVLLLEADRRGAPTALGSRNARAGSPFPAGSIVAVWGAADVVADARPTLRDLVKLARYALP
jgi:hypothetical protein